MYIVVIENTVKQDSIEKYAEVSTRFMNEMKTLPGMMDALVWKDEHNPSQILNVMMWESKDASKADDGSIFLKYKAELRPYFITNTSRTFEC